MENSWCRCKARGPQQDTGRNATPTCQHVGTRACSDIRNATWVHGDDFASIADWRWLEWMLKEKFETTTDIIGNDEVSTMQISGFRCEPDVRHSEMIVKELRLQGAKTLSTPVSSMQHESEELMRHEKFKKYQSLCARANFLAMDRIDLHFRAKESRMMCA